MVLAAQQRMAVLFPISVLTEALADLQKMLEVPEPLNSSPEGAAAQGPGSSAEVATALWFWMSGPYKISRGQAGKLAGGQHSSAREASSQEVNNNSKQGSNKRGPSDVLTLEDPSSKRNPVENIRAPVAYRGGHVLRLEMETLCSGVLENVTYRRLKEPRPGRFKCLHSGLETISLDPWIQVDDSQRATQDQR